MAIHALFMFTQRVLGHGRSKRRDKYGSKYRNEDESEQNFSPRIFKLLNYTNCESHAFANFKDCLVDETFANALQSAVFAFVVDFHRLRIGGVVG